MTNIQAEHIVVLAEDPGGANLLAAFIKKNALTERCRFVLSGPAINLFEAVLGPVKVETIDVMETLRPGSAMLLCATGNKYLPVIQAIRDAREQGIPSAAYLDHWTYYAIRFGKSGEWKENLPDEVWLTDNYALAQALKEGFPRDRLKVVGNPYMERTSDQIIRLRRERKRSTLRVLYLSEVLEEAPPHEGPTASEYRYDGHQILRDLVDAIQELRSIRATLAIRLHPSEAADKYDDYLASIGSEIQARVSMGRELSEDIALADIVVGAQTAALALALEAGVESVSYIPEGGIPCQLPHPELKRVSNREELSRALATMLATN